MKTVKAFFKKIMQIIILVLVLAFILALTFGGGYLIVTAFNFVVLKFLMGVASFSLGLACLNFIRNEALVRR